MPVVRVIEPMLLNKGHGVYQQYGVGEYWFGEMDVHYWWIRRHIEGGRALPPGSEIENPGPPVVVHPR
jgi:hypothetical protein